MKNLYQVCDQVERQVWDQVWDQVRNQVFSQVYRQVCDQVCDQVRNQVWESGLGKGSEMKTNKQNLLYLMMILVVGAISAYDNTMTWIFRETIAELEQNPVGSWLLEQGGVPLFVTVKSATTILLVVFLVSLIKTKYKCLVFIAFAFQLGMFIYLNMFSMEGGELVWNFGSRGWESDEYHPFRAFLNFVGKYYNCPFRGQPCPFEHIHFGE